MLSRVSAIGAGCSRQSQAPSARQRPLRRHSCLPASAVPWSKLQVPKAAVNHGSRKVSLHEGMRLVATRDGDYVSGPIQTEIWELTRSEWLDSCEQAKRQPVS